MIDLVKITIKLKYNLCFIRCITIFCKLKITNFWVLVKAINHCIFVEQENNTDIYTLTSTIIQQNRIFKITMT